ncbi:hypothetical protein [Streptomyces naphthomycinicus]|uniref:hypothetical protein n=1 Tax=Streptomyces naphthomycinicus TaxID=2872625 RepID=UPI001CED07DD|nr:hypothetical protein [Streptomyces sp. TML10]
MDDRQAEFIGLSLVEEIRAWQRDELPQLRTMWGDFVGNNATYAIIELYDAEGRLVDRSTGLYLRGGTRHAEIDALDQLALKQAHGGHAVIAVNRPPCGRPHGADASRRNCDDRITDLLRFHRITPHVYLTPHATDPTVRPGTADPAVLAPRGRWTHAAAGRPAPCDPPLSLRRSIDPAALRGWLLDQEIYRLRRHALGDPARAADPAVARIREAFEQEALRRSAEHVVTRALHPAAGAWREVELLPIVAPELPRGMARSTDPHHRGFLRTPQYDLVPYVPAPGARQAGYYLARNRQTGVDEWAIAPDLVEEFARGSAQHREFAEFLMERLRSEWDIESMRSLRHVHHNRPREAFDAWLRAWRAAFTSPAWLAEHALALVATLSRLDGLARGTAAAGRTGVRAVVGAAPAAEHLAEEFADAVRAALHVHDATMGPSGRSHKDSAPRHAPTDPHTHSDGTPPALPQGSGSDFPLPGSGGFADSAPAAFAQAAPDSSHGPGPASPVHTGITGIGHAASAQSTDHHSTVLPAAVPGSVHTAGTDQAVSAQTTPDDSPAMTAAAPGPAEIAGSHPQAAAPATHGPGDSAATGHAAFVPTPPDHVTPPPAGPGSVDSSAAGSAGFLPGVADEPRTGANTDTDTGGAGGAAGSSGGPVPDGPGAAQGGEAGAIPADPGGADAAAGFAQPHFPWTEFRDDAGNLYAIQDELGRITYNENHQETPTDGHHGHGDWFAPPAVAEPSHAGPDQAAQARTDHAQADPALQALVSHLLQAEGMAPAAGSGASFLDPGDAAAATEHGPDDGNHGAAAAGL